MGDVVSAGSYVAAVMELAGYKAQADFLQSFRDFFREAGAFIYVLAGVGAVVSIVNFGSYRAVRYLLIGPAIFWLLVTPTFRFDGVVWKIGAGTARGLHRQNGMGPAQADVNRALRGAFGYDGGPVDVAYGFALFVRVINTLVNQMNGIILEGQEDQAYRTFLHKGRAFDSFINSRPRNPLLIQSTQEVFLSGCIFYVGYGMALGSPELSDEAIDAMPQGKDAALRRRNRYLEEFRRASQERVNVTAVQKSNLGVEPNAGLAAVAGAAAAVAMNTISCEDAWKAVAGRIQIEANREALRTLGMARHDGAPQDVACAKLLEKITGERNVAGAQCLQKLQYATALFMTKNLLTDRQALPQFAMALLNPATGMGNQAQRAPRGWRLGASYGEATGLIGNADRTLRALDPNDVSSEDLARQSRNFSLNQRLSVMGGANLATEASFVDFPRYNTRKLVQQLFSWSLNAPWWQGVLLYLMGMIYPFLALVVLIPGRAQSFLLLPMAWLWIKSWDIGFAMCLVLERVLWSNMPPIRISQDVLKPLPSNTFDSVLRETQKVEPIWNVHGYYMVTAAALLAVPGVTGFVTLKSRRAILSSFTDKLLQDVKDKGDIAAAQVQIQAASGRAQLMHELQNNAIKAMRADPQLEATRTLAAATYATAAASESFVESQRSGDNLFASSLKAMSTYIQTGNDMLEKYEAADKSYALQFHPLFGRFGLFGISYDAEKAGADASGGFEMEGQYQKDNAAVDAFIDLHAARVNRMFSLTANLTNEALRTPIGRAALGYSFDQLMGNDLMGTLNDATLNARSTEVRFLNQEAHRREMLASIDVDLRALRANPAQNRDRITAAEAERARWSNVREVLGEEPRRVALAALSDARLREERASAQQAYNNRLAEVRANIRGYDSLVESPAMQRVIGSARTMFGEETLGVIRQGYLEQRGWTGALSPEQTAQVDEFMRPIRAQFAVNAQTFSTPVLMERVFGFTPTGVDRVRTEFGSGNQDPDAMRSYQTLDPYRYTPTGNTFDFYGVPHFVDRHRPQGAPTFPIEDTSGTSPPVGFYSPSIEPGLFRWRTGGSR